MNKLPLVFNIYEGILIEPTFLWLLAGPEASGGVLGGETISANLWDAIK